MMLPSKMIVAELNLEAATYITYISSSLSHNLPCKLSQSLSLSDIEFYWGLQILQVLIPVRGSNRYFISHLSMDSINKLTALLKCVFVWCLSIVCLLFVCSWLVCLQFPQGVTILSMVF